MSDYTLKVVDLSKSFVLHILNGKVIEALKDINFTVRRGEIVGLAGKSGAGKSTLIKCIYRTYLSTTGRILYNSRHQREIDLATASDNDIIKLRKTEITYCSQFLRVIPRVPAVDVVADSLVYQGVSWEKAREKARSYLSRLGLPEELWDAYPSTFSGGEQQRINVARSIIAEPHFLLIDEPTASLDQKTKEVVIDLILALKQKGTSILCISHDQFTMEEMTDRILTLEAGQIQQSAYL